MTNQVIPAQAVEAATRRLAAENGWEGPYPEGLARAALEAAAPHMHVPTAAEQAMDRILITLTAVAAGQVPQDVAFTVIREISEHYTDQRTQP